VNTGSWREGNSKGEWRGVAVIIHPRVTGGERCLILVYIGGVYLLAGRRFTIIGRKNPLSRTGR